MKREIKIEPNMSTATTIKETTVGILYISIISIFMPIKARTIDNPYFIDLQN
ncbi:MAG: hypothetical protein ABRQ38_09525 [Candidatus Eremiobacterota bacterium]